jgi:inward rectifier potassium channel
MALLRRRPRPAAEVEVLGKRTALFSDFYHLLLRSSWWLLVGVLVASFLALNALFAAAFHHFGGVANATTFGDHFFFSVQTMGTIGYGSMYPVSPVAHGLVTGEAIVSMLQTALSTGIIFTKFSVPRARMRFAKHPVIAPMDGVPTLAFRIGNEREASLIEAHIRVVFVRTERTREGKTIYRMYDLPLVRDRSPALTRSWMVMHRIEPGSFFHGADPESLARDEVELILTVTGIDEASTQTHHARHRYDHSHIVWGARHGDMLSELPDGRIRVDLTQFDVIEPSLPTDEFPYPRAARDR